MPAAYYIDFTIGSTFRLCKERSRLAFVEDLVPKEGVAPPLDFGSAFHAAIAKWLTARALQTDDPEAQAKRAFIDYLRTSGGNLPISMDNEASEPRSIERGLALLDCYFDRYRNEHYAPITRPDTGEPYVEMGFAVHFMDWRGTPVFLVGRIDALKLNRIDNKIYIFELKTTRIGLSSFVKRIRPNPQLTGYYMAAKELMAFDIAGVIWDAVFISTRQPNAKSKDPWLQNFGIDQEKDFVRVETRRSSVDVDEYLIDLVETTREYLELQERDLPRWTRSAPDACFMYNNPCPYLEICVTNINPSIIQSKFQKRRWEPWKGIVDATS